MDIPNYPNDGFVDTTLGWQANLEQDEMGHVSWYGTYPDGSTITLTVKCHHRDIGFAFLNMVIRDIRWIRYNKLKAGDELEKHVGKHFERMPIWFREVDKPARS